MTTKEEERFAARIEMLARLNEDACDGYAAAADLARSVPLSKRLLAWSDERKEFMATFRREAARAGLEIDSKGTAAAGVHRAWMGLRHFAKGSDEGLLDECLRGETSAIASYEYVLARSDWSSRATFRARVMSQLARIRSHASELEADLNSRIGARDEAATIRRAQVLVDSHHTLTLATVGDGGPWASSVSYVHDAFTFYFVSDPRSRHASNILSDARVSATINDDFAEWTDIRGVQLEGRGEIVSDLTARIDIFAKVLSRFPFLHTIEGDPEDVAAESSYAAFKITPSRLWLVDHDRGQHARFEIDLARSSVT
jgi:uncharacterized protein (TIGR02284 family)